MCVGITSNILQPSYSVFDAGAEPNLACTLFIQLKWRDCIPPIHNVFLRTVSDSPAQVIGKILLFVQLGNLHVRVHFDLLDNLALPLIFGTPFIDKFALGISLMERYIFPLQSRAVVIISEYTPLSDPLAVLQSDLDAEINTEDEQKKTMGRCCFESRSALQSPEYRKVCNTYSQQRWTYSFGATSEIDAKSNCPAGLRDLICPTARTEVKLSRKVCEKAEKVTQKYVYCGRDRLVRRYCLFGLGCNQQHRKYRGEVR